MSTTLPTAPRFRRRKINKQVIAIILIIIIALGVYSFFEHRSIRQFGAMQYLSYQEAAQELLTGVRDQAEAHNLRGIVSPVTIQDIKNYDGSIEGMHTDINIALASYNAWELEADSGTRAEITRRIDRLLGTYPPGMISEAVLQRIISARVDRALVNFFPGCEWQRGEFERGDVRIVLSLYTQDGAELFTIPVSFLHPATQSSIDKQRLQAEIVSIVSVSGFALIFGFVIITLVWNAYAGKKLASEIQKIKDLVDKGHFVTSLELAESYLTFFPDDTEIRAFREWLQDFTNNDPKKAQQAYVEAQKLKFMLTQHQKHQQIPLLNPHDDSSIKELIPYSPELSGYYSEIKQLEDRSKKLSEFESRLNSLKNAVREGMIRKARGMHDELKYVEPENAELSSLEKAIFENETDAKDKLAKAEEHLKKGEVSGARSLLDEIVEQYRDFDPAVTMLREFDNTRGKTRFLLNPVGSEKPAAVLIDDEIFFGRKDVDFIPHVEFTDKRISRRHARLRLSVKEVVIEDLQSAGGVFLNGEKITTQRIQDYDEVNLAGAAALTVLISKTGEGKVNGVIVQTSDCDYLILKEKVRVGIESGVLVFAENGTFLAYDDAIIAASDNKKCIVLTGEKQITIGEIKYSVEATK